MEAEEVVTRVLNWSDWTAWALVIALGIVVAIIALQWANFMDKKVIKAGEAAECAKTGGHEWVWNKEKKQHECKKCEFVAGTNGGPKGDHAYFGR